MPQAWGAPALCAARVACAVALGVRWAAGARAQISAEVTDANQASTKSVVELMSSVLTKVAESKDYDLMVEKAGASVLYGRRGVDLTDEVIRQMDALK